VVGRSNVGPNLFGHKGWRSPIKDSSESDDRQENSRVGVTLGWPLNKQNSLKFYASRGVVTNIGNDSDTFGVAWQYRWGD
jgi:hypothetical protein